jgi:hypothetical protein
MTTTMTTTKRRRMKRKKKKRKRRSKHFLEQWRYGSMIFGDAPPINLANNVIFK